MEKTGNVNHNHCVKADPQDPLPFCYTTDRNVRWEHCDCNDNKINSKNYDYLPDYPYTGYNFGQQGHCRVSTTIEGIVMLAVKSPLIR